MSWFMPHRSAQELARESETRAIRVQEALSCLHIPASHTLLCHSILDKEGKVMKGQGFFILMYALFFGCGVSWVWAHDPPPFPHTATFTTLITTPRAIEGLTGDH